MKKYAISSLLAGSIATALSMPVLAGDTGTVNFSGRILNNTCVVNVDGSGSDTATVTLPDSFTDSYDGDGTVGASKDFKIEVTGCDSQVQNLNLAFDGETDGASSRLKNTSVDASKATNVGITIKNPDNQLVVFDGATDSMATNIATNAGAATFNYTADVIQIGATQPTAGPYSAAATFQIMYR